MKRRRLPYIQRLVELAGGAATAYYGAKMIQYFYKMPEDIVGPMGFFIGIIGMEIVAIVKDTGPSVVRGLLQRLAAAFTGQKQAPTTDEDKKL